MTQHNLNPGSENVFQIFNGFAPKQGPKALTISFDFTTDNSIFVDFTRAEESNAISYIQSVFIDNSQNPNAVTLLFTITGQRIVCPAFGQSVFPVMCTLNSRLTVTTTNGAGVVVPMIFANVPMASELWGPVTVNIAAVNLVPVLGTFTDRSNTIAASNVSQPGAPINAARKRIIIENPSANIESLFINWTAAASATVNGSIELTPGGSFDSASGPVSTEALNVAAITVGHTYVIKEM